MKKIQITILLLLIIEFFTACDYVEPNFNNIYYTSDTITTGGTTTDTINNNIFDSTKRVLLIEFTGIRCTNCPDAHETIRLIKAQYPNNFLSVSFHGTTLARPIGDYANEPDLRTQEGNQLISDFEISEIPQGIVDYFDKTHLSYKDQWTAQVANQVNQIPSVALLINIDTNTQNINIKIKTISQIANPTKLCAYILEDSIITKQATNESPGYIEQYVQMNVFRKSITDIYGSQINLSQNEITEQNLSYSLNNDWNKKHLKLIVFLYQTTDFKIINAIEKHF